MRKSVILLVLLSGQTLWGAVSPTVVWEVNSVGSNTNGGGYKTGATGTDYSQQANAQYALTGVTYGLVCGADFTLQADSPCFGTGLKPSTIIGVD